MMEAAPASPLVVAEPNLLFELLVIPLDAPAQLRLTDQLPQGRLWRQGREPVLGWRTLALRPFDQEPLLGTWLVSQFIPMGRTGPHGRKARGQNTVRANAPCDALPGDLRQRSPGSFSAASGFCSGLRRTRVGGRPRPLQGLGGSGADPGARRLVED